MENVLGKIKHKMTTSILLFIPLTLAAQNPVTGVVSDSEGAAIVGISVIEKGTNNGAVTGLDGKFSLSLKQSPATLVFSMVGMATQEKSVNAGDILNVAMQEDVLSLEQVIVTGYTSQKKADLTGAVSIVKVSDMMTAAENNPIKALQGRVAGMSITGDGNPSGAATVRIRGDGTMNDNDPLYVIDGVPTKGGMHELNSNDIESIQVLKDASSASIYGSRAANGVIIITTKQGKQGKVKVNFDSYLTASVYGKNIKMMNTKQYGEALFRARINSGYSPNDNNLGYLFDYSYDDNGYAVLNGMSVPKFIDAKDGTNLMPSSDTDWFDEVTRTGILQSYNLSISNGTDKSNTFFSLGYLDNKGTVKQTEFNRISARLNSSFKLLDDIVTIGENLSLNRTHELTMPGGVLDLAKMSLPIMPVRKANGDYGSVTSAMNDRDNPVRVLDANKDNPYNYWRLFGNAFVDIQPVKNLHIKTSFGIDYGNYYQRSLTYSFTGRLGSDLTSSKMQQSHAMKWNWANTATYDLTFGKNRMDFLLGMEMNSSQDLSFASEKQTYELETPDYMYPSAGTGEAFATGGATGYSLLSYFGKINYVYDDKYLASVTLRRDGSSRFGKNNRFATFPAFSAGWRISNESFMESTSNIISDLKLRAAWGQTGNQEIDNLANRTILITNYIGETGSGINTGTAYDINGANSGLLPSGYQLNQRGNDNIKWETTTQTNIGLDFSLFEQTLYGTIEWYLKQTDDILIKPPYLGAIGEGGDQWVNGASMENRGIEFTLGYRNKTAFGLNYDIVGNISGYRNKITKLPESVVNSYGGNGTTDNILGRPIDSYYGYVANGLFRTQDDIDSYVAQTGMGVGRIRYANLFDDGVINENDRTWIGNPHPDFEFGLNIYLEYKGFDLNMFLQGVCGNMVINDTKQFTDFWAVAELNMNKGTRLLDAFDPVSNPNSDIPMISLTDDNNEKRFSSYYVESGSYLKLRNMQIGYSLPTALIQKAKLDKVRLYLSGQNLFTLKSANFTGLDPENPNLAYPISTTFTLGINVSF
jgi:TonB-linked SusC/RagA family outer membrane protein